MLGLSWEPGSDLVSMHMGVNLSAKKQKVCLGGEIALDTLGKIDNVPTEEPAYEEPIGAMDDKQEQPQQGLADEPEQPPKLQQTTPGPPPEQVWALAERLQKLRERLQLPWERPQQGLADDRADVSNKEPLHKCSEEDNDAIKGTAPEATATKWLPSKKLRTRTSWRKAP